MNGQESLWGWLGLGVLTAGIGTAMTLLLTDWMPAVVVGAVLATVGGLLTTICAIGIGVTAGMLRYDHLRRR